MKMPTSATIVSAVDPADAVCSVCAVSQAPKEAPVRKYLPSSVYLEEKTDEQKKEEVRTR